MCSSISFERSLSAFSHKTGTVFSTEIKRNLAILEDTLGQCASESTAHYDGNLSELRVQLERMMVSILLS